MQTYFLVHEVCIIVLRFLTCLRMPVYGVKRSMSVS